jgi:5-methylcytosine-specific restriction endonuclease McrA
VRDPRARGNPDWYARQARSQNRRAAGRAVGLLTADHVRRLYEANDECFWCERALGAALLGTVDHVLPLGLGGENRPWNLVLACHECNSSKKGKAPGDWEAPVGHDRTQAKILARTTAE